MQTNVIIHGDCLEVMAGWSANCVDAIVTDPPWMDYTTGRYDASKHHRPIVGLAPEEYLVLCYRAVRNPGAVLLWCRWDVFDLHARAAEKAGWKVKNQIVWAKSNHTAGDLSGNAGYQHECAVFAVKGKWKRFTKRETNLWQEKHLFSRAHRWHPTQKPVGLMLRSIRWVTPPRGLVLDPFAGSGSTCVAAIQGGFRYIGIEIDPEYANIARLRILKELKATGQIRLLAPGTASPAPEGD